MLHINPFILKCTNFLHSVVWQANILYFYFEKRRCEEGYHGNKDDFFFPPSPLLTCNHKVKPARSFLLLHLLFDSAHHNSQCSCLSPHTATQSSPWSLQGNLHTPNPCALCLSGSLVLTLHKFYSKKKKGYVLNWKCRGQICESKG